jgi:bifunctional UDP-N-acetylglucosamine pyrophosphorylase / glucosamine-1-phosphate N-acetyltransferase
MGRSALASIILAAGQGTRMKSDRAKVLHPLGGDPLVAYPLRLAIEVDANPIVLVIGHQKEAVRERVEALFPGRIAFAEQADQRGTGHAAMEGVKHLASHRGRVLLLYGDVPLLRASTIARLVREMDDNFLDLALISTNVAEPKGYGRVVRGAGGKIERIVEEKDATDEQRRIREINAGIYLVEAVFLTKALSELRADNAQKEYYLTDVVEIAIKDGRKVGAVAVDESTEVLGANTRVELAALDRVVRARTNERFMLEGVTIIDPATTYINTQAKIGRETVIHPGVHIRGATEIGPGCTIDVGVVMTDATIAADVVIKPYTVIEGARVERGAIVGPYSRLRPGARIMEGAHVGNFVELKNTELGKGAKANHLAYLGDATIGEGSNIGAGTITCNYDGFGKYRTEIGESVFIGSNATLVAPVRIDREAYVAAGSTITEHVKENDLAFGRARQVTKGGRAREVREAASARAASKSKGK